MVWENEIRRNHDKYKATVMGKTSQDPVFKCEGTSISLVEEVELLGVTVDVKVRKSNQENISQSEPANRCSEKDEEVASFKAAGKAL